MSHIKTLAIVTLAASAIAVPTLALAEGGGGGGGVTYGTPNSGNVNITGSVALKCDITNDPVTLALGELAGAGGTLDTSKVNGHSVNLTGWCNGTKSTMSVQATSIALTPALPTNQVPSGFDQSVDYTATATANSVSATDSSSTPGAGSAVTVGAFTGNIGVSLSSASASGLLVAGSYQGTTTVTLTPGM